MMLASWEPVYSCSFSRGPQLLNLLHVSVSGQATRKGCAVVIVQPAPGHALWSRGPC